MGFPLQRSRAETINSMWCTIRLLPVLLAVLLTACAAIPAQEMSDARQAIQSAEQAGAAAHAPRALDLARSLLEQAQTELAVKDYAAARRSAHAAKSAAIQAREAADDAAREAPRQDPPATP